MEGCLLVIEESAYIRTGKLITILNLRKGLGAIKHLAL